MGVGLGKPEVLVGSHRDDVWHGVGGGDGKLDNGASVTDRHASKLIARLLGKPERDPIGSDRDAVGMGVGGRGGIFNDRISKGRPAEKAQESERTHESTHPWRETTSTKNHVLFSFREAKTKNIE